MDLKEFIVETISAVVDATSDLQDKYKERDVLINPPTAKSAAKVYKEGSENYVYRHVKDVDFDVALTVSSAAGGEGKAGIKVFSAEIAAGGSTSKSTEQVSRVQFSIPLTLSPTASEEKNIEVRKTNEETSKTEEEEERMKRVEKIVFKGV